MCGARAVTVRDGGQTLDVCAEQLTERFLFRVTQFRKLLCHMGNRAVVLADLNAVTHWSGGRGKSGGAESVGDGVCRLRHAAEVGGICRFDISHNCLDSTLGELLDSRVATDFAELAHCRPGKIVVRVTETATSSGSDLKLFGRTPTSTLTERRRGCRAGFTGLDQRVQVTPDTGGTQTESRADFGGRDGSLFEEKFDHRCPSLAFTTHRYRHYDRTLRGSCSGLTCIFLALSTSRISFHNTSVTEFLSQVY